MTATRVSRIQPSATVPTTTMSTMPPHCAVNIFTGYMGAGKTTIIYNTIQQLKQIHPHQRIAWLKNEFGTNQVDTLLAAELNTQSATTTTSADTAAVTGVVELLNGCICCTLIGQLGDAIQSLLTTYHPDRIIIESSGAASPMPLVTELKRLRDTESSEIYIDSVICVIDLCNYQKIVDVSYSAKLQAKYTDCILLNKYELLLQQSGGDVGVTDRQVDVILDDVYELNGATSKLRTVNGSVDCTVLYDTATNLIDLTDDHHDTDHTHNGHAHNDTVPHDHHSSEVVVVNWINSGQMLDQDILTEWLDGCDADTFYRIKGVLQINNTADNTTHVQLINYAFGHYTLTPLTQKVEKFGVTMVLRRETNVKFVIKTVKRDLKLTDELNTLTQVT